MRARHGVGHGVEAQTWPFRSAPCLSIRQVRHGAIVRSARLPSRNCMRDTRKPVDMWTTQARCPQTHRIKNNKSKRQFDCFGSAAVKPRYVTVPTAATRQHCAAPSLRGSRQPFTPLVGQRHVVPLQTGAARFSQMHGAEAQWPTLGNLVTRWGSFCRCHGVRMLTARLRRWKKAFLYGRFKVALLSR